MAARRFECFMLTCNSVNSHQAERYYARLSGLSVSVVHTYMQGSVCSPYSGPCVLQGPAMMSVLFDVASGVTATANVVIMYNVARRLYTMVEEGAS